MINKDTKKTKKLLKITNIDDKDLNKLSYKEKQQYYKAKSQLCSVSFVSRDKDGKGITYVKPKKQV